MTDQDPNELEPPAPQPEPPKPLWRRPAVLAAAVVVLLVVAVVAITRSDSGPSKSQAIADCHRVVRDKLRSPATASFDADEKASAGEAESGSGKGNLVISGTVDSQNGFGATVRSSYFCIAVRDGDKYTIAEDDVILI